MKVTTVESLAGQIGKVDAPRRNVLLLADNNHAAAVVRDHIQGIVKYSRHNIFIVNPICRRSGYFLDLEKFDAVIIHYSICTLFDYYFPENYRIALEAFGGAKIQIIQDECRWVDRMCEKIRSLGVDAVFSSMVPENIAKVYGNKNLLQVDFVSSLPGYVSDRLLRIKPAPLGKRKYDIVYRGRSLPIWMGKFAREKTDIVRHAINLRQIYKITIDCKTDEQDRIYGRAWDRFLESGRAALATEGGATVFDFDESIARDVQKFSEQFPNSSEEEIWQKVVAPHEDNIIHKTITPRVFEAIAHKTALVMYPGDFRGVLKPWEHYIPLERDGSNYEMVIETLCNDKKLLEVIENAYSLIGNNTSLHYSRYAAAIDEVIDDKTKNSDCQRNGDRLSLNRPLMEVFGYLDKRVSAFSAPHALEFRVRYWVVTYVWQKIVEFRKRYLSRYRLVAVLRRFADYFSPN